MQSREFPDKKVFKRIAFVRETLPSFLEITKDLQEAVELYVDWLTDLGVSYHQRKLFYPYLKPIANSFIADPDYFDYSSKFIKNVRKYRKINFSSRVIRKGDDARADFRHKNHRLFAKKVTGVRPYQAERWDPFRFG